MLTSGKKLRPWSVRRLGEPRISPYNLGMQVNSMESHATASPIPGSRAVFIVGFERCMTTSLSQYLVDMGFGSLLVAGVKEPSIFATEPELARRRVERHTSNNPGAWLLDASVDYIFNSDALHAIARTVEDARFIVCLRNQFQRTRSAYAYYQTVHGQPVTPASLAAASLKFGDETVRQKAVDDPLAPTLLRRQPPGRYIHTAVVASIRGFDSIDPTELAKVDIAVEEFARSALSKRLIEEFRHWKRTGLFPPISVLLSSYFAYGVEKLLAARDATKVLLVTASDPGVRQRLAAKFESFLGVRATRQTPFPHTNASKYYPIDTGELALAERLIGPSLVKDSWKVMDLVRSFRGLDLSLFSPAALYFDRSPVGHSSAEFELPQSFLASSAGKRTRPLDS